MPDQPMQTHPEGCWRVHHECAKILIEKLMQELEQERRAKSELAVLLLRNLYGVTAKIESELLTKEVV